MPSKKVFNRISKGAIGVGAISAGGGVTQRVKRLQIRATPTGSEQDTGWDLPIGAVVTDVALKVVTAEATGTTKTMDVGLKAGEAGGDADGFLAAVSVATTGVKLGAMATGAVTRGDLLKETVAATPAYAKRDHVTNGTAQSVVYTAKSANWAEFRGDIVITYLTGL